MRIKQVIPKENYHLLIQSEDGQQGMFDVNPYLKSEAFLELQKSSEFQKIRNGKYFIEWDCGADLSADTIEAGWKTA
jgi:hypothetical protein